MLYGSRKMEGTLFCFVNFVRTIHTNAYVGRKRAKAMPNGVHRKEMPLLLHTGDRNTRRIKLLWIHTHTEISIEMYRRKRIADQLCVRVRFLCFSLGLISISSLCVWGLASHRWCVCLFSLFRWVFKSIFFILTKKKNLNPTLYTWSNHERTQQMSDS